eukprot:TRINITY_DN4479_c0_g1_i2.p1 TRINITY_DN4479_c0_g1~~TRINITY_DN4479_c0_g1_i2.p1  ORF type:complete len:144 (-),score=21.79 TRINITY_DN4479_c0_g1_i2:110-541(-)
MSPRSVSNSGSITPPRPSRRPVASCSPSPAREEPVPEAQPEQEPKIFVVNLIDEITEDNLRSFFESCGEVIDVYIKKNDRGPFAFVKFTSMEEAQKATEMSGNDWNGKQIRVSLAKPRGGNRNSRACFKCNQEGHMAKNCPGV